MQDRQERSAKTAKSNKTSTISSRTSEYPRPVVSCCMTDGAGLRKEGLGVSVLATAGLEREVAGEMFGEEIGGRIGAAEIDGES